MEGTSRTWSIPAGRCTETELNFVIVFEMLAEFLFTYADPKY